MTDDNSTNELVDIPESLEDFKSVFFDKPEADKAEDTEDNALAPDEDKDAPEGDEDVAEEEVSEDDASDESEDDDDASDDEEESEDEDDDEEEDKEDKEPRKKSRYQTRISELTRNYREEQRERARERAEFMARIEALETTTRKDSAEDQSSIKKQLPQGAPTPDALDEKGDPVYPLGQFDPQFLLDITNFSIDVKTKEIEDRRAQEIARTALAAEQAALVTDWQDRLTKYEEEVPDVRDHIEDLTDTFKDVQPQYGEYLATTIMQCENGPAIMEYLSQNIGEAQKIVASGPSAATLAIGRLDDKLAKVAVRANEEEKRNKKISGSAPPPPQQVRGSSKGRTSTRPDTTDLAAFKREFLK
jgi:hypothetical protein